MAIFESGEMYLETILVLSEKNDKVRAVDVGEYMGFSKPSVSRALGNLKEEGLVLVDEARGIVLTDEGRVLAEKIYERHRVLTEALMMLGVDEVTAEDDACKIEHVISDKAFEIIRSKVKK